MHRTGVFRGFAIASHTFQHRVPVFTIGRVLPRNTPLHARETLKYDILSGVGRAAFQACGAGTAAVVANKALGADAFLVALLFSAAHLGQIGTIWVPRLLDRFGAVRFIVFVELLCALFIGATGLATEAVAFVLVVCGGYAMHGLATPAYSRVYRQNYPTAMRGQLFSITVAVMNGVLAITSFAAGRMLNAQPEFYRIIFPALAIVAVLGAAAFSRIRVRNEEEISGVGGADRFLQVWRIISTDRRYMFFLVIWSIFGFSNLMLEPVRVLFVADDQFIIRADYLQSLLILMVIPQATVMVSLPLWGWLLDRYPVVYLRVAMQVAALINVAMFIWTPTIGWLYVAGIFRGLGQAGGHITWPLAMMEFSPRSRVSEYTAVHTMLTGIRGIFAPQIAAVLLTLYGPENTFWVGFAGMALSIALFAIFPRVTRAWPVAEGAPPPRKMPLFR